MRSRILWFLNYFLEMKSAANLLKIIFIQFRMNLKVPVQMILSSIKHWAVRTDSNGFTDIRPQAWQLPGQTDLKNPVQEFFMGCVWKVDKTQIWSFLAQHDDETSPSPSLLKSSYNDSHDDDAVIWQGVWPRRLPADGKIMGDGLPLRNGSAPLGQ